MNRWSLSLVTLLCLLTSAAANPPRAKDPAPVERPAEETPKSQGTRKEISPSESSRYVLTQTTEVELDSRPCSYEAVPGNAIIVRMEVDEDERTILKIAFRSRR